MLHILTIIGILSFPFILISVMYSQASKVWASQREAHEALTAPVTTDANTTDDGDEAVTDTCPVLLIGQNEVGDLVWGEWLFPCCALDNSPPQPGRCQIGIEA